MFSDEVCHLLYARKRYRKKYIREYIHFQSKIGIIRTFYRNNYYQLIQMQISEKIKTWALQTTNSLFHYYSSLVATPLTLKLFPRTHIYTLLLQRILYSAEARLARRLEITKPRLSKLCALSLSLSCMRVCVWLGRLALKCCLSTRRVLAFSLSLSRLLIERGAATAIVFDGTWRISWLCRCMLLLRRRRIYIRGLTPYLFLAWYPLFFLSLFSSR